MADSNEDRLLTVKEVADFLQVSPRTVLKLVNSGDLPGAKVGNQWRFNKAKVGEWVSHQARPEGEPPPDLETIPDGATIPLNDLLSDRTIIPNLETTTREGIIDELAQRALQLGLLLDKGGFVDEVLAREELLSTAIPGGVAFLHTRKVVDRPVAKPFIVLGRSGTGVDFGAPDGQPTYLFFLLGLRWEKLHLPVLGRLARMMHGTHLADHLMSAPTALRIYDMLLRADREAVKKAK